jgi:hypothetical protein
VVEADEMPAVELRDPVPTWARKPRRRKPEQQESAALVEERGGATAEDDSWAWREPRHNHAAAVGECQAKRPAQLHAESAMARTMAGGRGDYPVRRVAPQPSTSGPAASAGHNDVLMVYQEGDDEIQKPHCLSDSSVRRGALNSEPSRAGSSTRTRSVYSQVTCDSPVRRGARGYSRVTGDSPVSWRAPDVQYAHACDGMRLPSVRIRRLSFVIKYRRGPSSPI